MRRWWPYILIALACLPAAFPYLNGGIPRSNDSLAHLYRAVELDRLIRAGIFFPRWAPDFAHGFGYPIFNYFAYLSHYLTVLFHSAGLPMLSALRASYITALLASGLTAYLLGRDLCSSNGTGAGGEGGGLLTAIAYVYSPYLLYTAHVRGGLPENLALAFFPLALWALRRSLLHHQDTKAQRHDQNISPPILPALSASLRLNFTDPYTILAALATAGFIASHIGMALQYLPLLALFGLYTLAAPLLHSGEWRNPRHWLFGIWNLSFVILLALGLTAFLWLPAVAELQFVQFTAAFSRAGLIYRENFFQWQDLIAYPRLPVYIDVLNPPVVRSLSLPAIAVALWGWLRWRSMTRAARADYAFLFALFAICAFLILDISKPVWDAVGMLQRSTFPWRFLGPASLFAAALTGIAISPQRPAASNQQSAVNAPSFVTRSGHSSLFIVSLFIASLFIASSLPFLFVPREPAPNNPTPADFARFEIPPLLVGTTTTGEYTPVWVKEFPDTSAMQREIIEGREPERLDAPGATVEHLSASPARDTYRLSASQPTTATYRSFYFPGWQVSLDGQSIEIIPTDPHGLIAFDLPAGQHSLDIRFASTPIRTAAGWISAACWLFAIGYGVSAISGWRQTQHQILDFGIWNLKFEALFTVSLFIVSFLIPRPGPPPTQHPLNLDFGGELTLLGYDQSPITNHQSAITLVWQARHPIGVPYGMNIRLTDDLGLVWSDTNIERPRDWRFFPGTDFWPPDKFILDSYLLKSLRGAPPGVYHLEAIAYRADTLQALSVQRIGEYLIEKATNEPPAAPLASFDGIALIAAEADRAAAAPGDPYRLTLRWQAAADSPPEQTLQLALVDSSAAVVHTRTEPVVPQYLPPRWKKDDVLTQYVFFRLPASLPSGGFHWRIGGVDLLSLNIAAPDRLFDPPTLTHTINAEIGSSILLLGYNTTIGGNAITVDLAWQAKSEMSGSYRVFLHLLDADGNLVSQSDGEPADWTRPTTGWRAGEVVIDSRALAAPGPGEYTLSVGMVNEAGERIGEPTPLGAIILAP